HGDVPATQSVAETLYANTPLKCTGGRSGQRMYLTTLPGSFRAPRPTTSLSTAALLILLRSAHVTPKFGRIEPHAFLSHSSAVLALCRRCTRIERLEPGFPGRPKFFERTVASTREAAY